MLPIPTYPKRFSLLLSSIPHPPRPPQAFVDELINHGKMGWLVEFESSEDKKGLIAKVHTQQRQKDGQSRVAYLLCCSNVIGFVKR